MVTRDRNNDTFEKPDALKSKSGTFFIDGKGIVQRFEPSSNNPFFEEKTEKDANDTFGASKSIRTFVVPEGVEGFTSDFMRGIRIVERFELPEGLKSIGNNSSDIEKGCHCVFANCILPEVVIPQSVQEIGNFAFGHSRIEVLKLPATLRSPYGRQFKDSHIGKLRLPREWNGYVALGKYNDLRLDDQWLDNNQYGYLRWPSTYIENIEFY